MTKPAPMRLFVAADLTDKQKTVLLDAQQKLNHSAQRLSLTKPQNIHLTLRFLGDVAPDQVADIKQMLLEQAPPLMSSAWTQLIGLGRFRRREGDLVFVRLEASPALHELIKQLEEQFQQLGFSRETRAWQPHVTVARRVEWSRLPDWWHDELTSAREEIGAIHLYHSQFTPHGVSYRSLCHIKSGKI